MKSIDAFLRLCTYDCPGVSISHCLLQVSPTPTRERRKTVPPSTSSSSTSGPMSHASHSYSTSAKSRTFYTCSPICVISYVLYMFSYLRNLVRFIHVLHLRNPERLLRVFKDAMPVSFRSELFTSYILTIFRQDTNSRKYEKLPNTVIYAYKIITEKMNLLKMCDFFYLRFKPLRRNI